MPTILQLRRGSTADNDAYTGSVGELTVDTTLNTVRVHDGSTAGGTVVGGSTGNIQVAVTGDNEIDTSSGNLTIDSAGGTVTVDDNLTVSGNLTVNGTTTTVNSTNTTLDDNLLELNSGASTNANDSGIIIERGSTGDNAIIAWDESADKFVVGTTTATASDTGNLTISTGTLVANIEATTATLGGSNVVSTDNSLTLTNKTLTSPKIGTSILDTNGNELFNVTATASAVNEITYANAATGNGPTLTASGDDTNIDINITPKGSGQVVIDSLKYPSADGTADQILKTDGSGNLSFADAAGGGGCDYTPTSSTTNIVISETQNTSMTGWNNTVIGDQAGMCLTRGFYNTFIGSYAGMCATSANHNTSVGSSAGLATTTGEKNTSIGSGAGNGITTGSCNVSVGDGANFKSGAYGVGTTTGNNNVVIGWYAQPSSEGASNEITIGNTTHNLLRIPGLGSTDGQVLTYSSSSGGIVLADAAGGGAAVNICNSNNVVTDTLGGDGGTGSHNIFLGLNTGCSNTTGADNIFLGRNAGKNIATGKRNVIMGSYAACVVTNTDTQMNTIIGFNAGQKLSSQSNVMIGAFAGTSVTGRYNVLVGTYAGRSMTTAENNIAIGNNAMRNGRSGCHNIAIGHNVLQSGFAKESVFLNTNDGPQSTSVSTQYTISIGNRNMKCLTTGVYNTSIGGRTMCTFSRGFNNIAIGNRVGMCFIEACRNIFIGDNAAELAGQLGVVPTDNVGVGRYALKSVEGTQNVAIGANAASTLVTGTNNVMIGQSAQPSTATTSHEITLGNSGHTILRTAANIVPFTTNTQDLGAVGNVWANIYTGDLNLSNEDGAGNSIDGTTGNWTIQEGANDLFLINNKSGKKYKFNIEEV